MGPEEVRLGINYVSSNSVCIRFLSVTVFINSVSIKGCLAVASLVSETDKLGCQGFRYFNSAQMVGGSILAAFIRSAFAKQRPLEGSTELCEVS